MDDKFESRVESLKYQFSLKDRVKGKIRFSLNKIKIIRMQEQNHGFSLQYIAGKHWQRGSPINITAQQYDSLQLTLLQECDRLQLQKTTKFLAKTYFDIAATSFSHLSCQNSLLYLLTAFFIAVKYNQNRAISDHFTFGGLVLMSEGRFQQEQFRKAEFQLLKKLQFCLHMNSPYDLAPLLKPMIRSCTHRKARMLKLQAVLDFAISLPKLVLAPSLPLFIACSLSALEDVLTAEHVSSLMQMSGNADMVLEIKGFLETAFSAFEGQNM